MGVTPFRRLALNKITNLPVIPETASRPALSPYGFSIGAPTMLPHSVHEPS